MHNKINLKDYKDRIVLTKNNRSKVSKRVFEYVEKCLKKSLHIEEDEKQITIFLKIEDVVEDFEKTFYLMIYIANWKKNAKVFVRNEEIELIKFRDMLNSFYLEKNTMPDYDSKIDKTTFKKNAEDYLKRKDIELLITPTLLKKAGDCEKVLSGIPNCVKNEVLDIYKLTVSTDDIDTICKILDSGTCFIHNYVSALPFYVFDCYKESLKCKDADYCQKTKQIDNEYEDLEFKGNELGCPFLERCTELMNTGTNLNYLIQEIRKNYFCPKFNREKAKLYIFEQIDKLQKFTYNS